MRNPELNRGISGLLWRISLCLLRQDGGTSTSYHEVNVHCLRVKPRGSALSHCQKAGDFVPFSKYKWKSFCNLYYMMIQFQNWLKLMIIIIIILSHSAVLKATRGSVPRAHSCEGLRDLMGCWGSGLGCLHARQVSSASQTLHCFLSLKSSFFLEYIFPFI